MSELEYNQLLESVRMAIEPVPQEDFFAVEAPLFDEPPQAANDNRRAWTMVPFPEGWYASC